MLVGNCYTFITHYARRLAAHSNIRGLFSAASHSETACLANAATTPCARALAAFLPFFPPSPLFPISWLPSFFTSIILSISFSWRPSFLTPFRYFSTILAELMFPIFLLSSFTCHILPGLLVVPGFPLSRAKHLSSSPSPTLLPVFASFACLCVSQYVAIFAPLINPLHLLPRHSLSFPSAYSLFPFCLSSAPTLSPTSSFPSFYLSFGSSFRLLSLYPLLHFFPFFSTSSRWTFLCLVPPFCPTAESSRIDLFSRPPSGRSSAVPPFFTILSPPCILELQRRVASYLRA